MEQQEEWKMTPLDAMICSNQLQIMKSLVFLLPPNWRRQLIFLVKLMELRQCLSLPSALLGSPTADFSGKSHFPDMFERICPYCDKAHQQSFQQMQNAFQMMQTIQQMSASGMMNNLGDMMGGFAGFGGMSGMSGMGGMGAMNGAGGPDQTDNTDSPDPGISEKAPDTAENSDNQLISMLSSMMNPEQQALFHEYESMLNEME